MCLCCLAFYLTAFGKVEEFLAIYGFLTKKVLLSVILAEGSMERYTNLIGLMLTFSIYDDKGERS